MRRSRDLAIFVPTTTTTTMTDIQTDYFTPAAHAHGVIKQYTPRGPRPWSAAVCPGLPPSSPSPSAGSRPSSPAGAGGSPAAAAPPSSSAAAPLSADPGRQADRQTGQIDVRECGEAFITRTDYRPGHVVRGVLFSSLT